MKKLYVRITVCLFACLFSIILQAKEVNKQTAEKIAINAFTQLSYNKNVSGFQTKEILTVKTGEKNAFYIVNFNPTGFIILSASDAVTPILGSSAEANFSLENMPPQLSYLFDIYKKQIKEIEEQKINPTEEIKQKWNKYSTDNTSSIPSNSLKSATAIPAQVSPLLSTTWHQNAGWNRFCPVNASGPGGHCLAGCTAVAFAQVLYYWGCKVNESGTIIDSNYGNLSANLTDANYYWTNMGASTSDDNNALLIYHCAIAAQTSFGPSSSPGNTVLAMNALVSNFGFKNSIAQESSSTSGWINKLKEELSLARPMVYEGYGSTAGENGHAWVIDGYDANDNFHCNWGWGGSSDGYYQLNDLHPRNTNYTFNIFNWATLGIEPVMSTCDEINGSNVICSSGTSFNVPNLLYGATVTWTASSNISILSSQPSNPCTFQANGTGAGWIEATIHNNGNATLERKSAWVGLPVVYSYGNHLVVPDTSTPITSLCLNARNECQAVHPAGYAYIDQWEWRVTGGGSVYPYGYPTYQYASVYPSTSSSRIEIRAHNACGWTDWAAMYAPVVNCTTYMLSISPNPSVDQVSVELKSADTEKQDLSKLEWDLDIYDSFQGLKEKKTKLKNSETKINTSDWKDGIYIVRAIIGGQTITEKMMVKH